MEKIYKTMRSTGVGSLVTGIVLIFVSVGIGVYMIVNGARLLKGKTGLIF